MYVFQGDEQQSFSSVFASYTDAVVLKAVSKNVFCFFFSLSVFEIHGEKERDEEEKSVSVLS